MSRFVRVLTAGLVVATGLTLAPADAASITKEPLSQYTITWQGQTWTLRNTIGKARPGPDYWVSTPLNVTTDAQDRLHMTTEKLGTLWCGVGISSTRDDYGYGTYRMVLDSRLAALDPMAVIGMFTFNEDPADGHQETDIELSRWGQPSSTAHNTQFAIQPWDVAGHLRRYLTNPDGKPMTYEFTWRPSKVVFRVRQGAGASAPVVRRWTSYALPGAPHPGTHMNFNLWFYRGDAPYGNEPQSATIRSFTYDPL